MQRVQQFQQVLRMSAETSNLEGRSGGAKPRQIGNDDTEARGEQFVKPRKTWLEPGLPWTRMTGIAIEPGAVSTNARLI